MFCLSPVTLLAHCIVLPCLAGQADWEQELTDTINEWSAEEVPLFRAVPPERRDDAWWATFKGRMEARLATGPLEMCQVRVCYDMYQAAVESEDKAIKKRAAEARKRTRDDDAEDDDDDERDKHQGSTVAGPSGTTGAKRAKPSPKTPASRSRKPTPKATGTDKGKGKGKAHISDKFVQEEDEGNEGQSEQQEQDPAGDMAVDDDAAPIEEGQGQVS